jgi:hypothetical protein
MVISIIGSRTFDNYDLLCETMKGYDNLSLIVSGGAKGADSLGERWANENNIRTLIFKPEWEFYGKRAAFIRNQLIVVNCDQVIAFWDGESKGTKHALDLCKKINKPYTIINI